MCRLFASCLEDRALPTGQVIPKTQKRVLEATLLNTQHYKVRIKAKVEQSRKIVTRSPTPRCCNY